MAAADLLVRVKGDTSDVNSKLGALGENIGKLGRLAAGAAVAGGVAIATVGVKGVVAFAGFEKGMKEVFTLLPDISGEAMGDMEDQVLDLAKTMGILPDQVVPALYQAISAGVPTENVFDFMELASKAAIGGVTDLETAVDGITSVVNAYGVENVTAAEASDLMLLAVRGGKTTFEELSASLFQVNPVAAGLGVSFGDVSASLAAITAQGIPTSVAATQIRGALVELGKEGTIASDMFQELSGVTFTEFIASGGDMKGAFDLMAEGAADMGVGVGDLFGSVDAGMAVIALTSDAGAVKFGESLEAMRNASGTTQLAFETMDTGLSRSWDKIKANVSVALIGIGESLAPMVERFSEAFQDKLPVMIEAAEALFANIATFVTGTVIPAFQALSAWWDENGPAIVAIVESVKEGIVEAFNIVVDSVKWMIENWEDLKVPMQVIGTLILTVMIPHWVALAIAALVSAAKQVVAWVMIHVAAVASVATAIGVMVVFAIKWAWLATKSLIAGAKIALAWLLALGPIGLLIAAVSLAVGLIVANWDTIKSAALSFKNWIVEKFNAVVKFFKELPGTIKSFVTDVIEAAKSLGAGIISGIISGVTGLGSALLDRLKSGISGAISNAKSFLGIGSPSKVMAEQIGEPMAAGISGPVRTVMDWAVNVKPKPPVSTGANWDMIKIEATEVKDWIIDEFKEAITFLRTLPRRIETATAGLFDSVKDAVRELPPIIRKFLMAFVDAIRELPGIVRKFAKFFADAGLSLGEAIKQGILAGIEGLGSALLDKLKAAIGAAISGAAKFLEGGPKAEPPRQSVIDRFKEDREKDKRQNIIDKMIGDREKEQQIVLDRFREDREKEVIQGEQPYMPLAPPQTTIVLQVGDSEMGRWVLDLAGMDRQTLRTV